MFTSSNRNTNKRRMKNKFCQFIAAFHSKYNLYKTNVKICFHNWIADTESVIFIASKPHSLDEKNLGRKLNIRLAV